jgi:hypothetical protein
MRPGRASQTSIKPAGTSYEKQVRVRAPHGRADTGLPNQLLQRLVARRELQTKLEVGRPGDPFEREADRVAEEVAAPAHRIMRQPEIQLDTKSSVQRCPGGCGPIPCDHGEDESPLLQPNRESARGSDITLDSNPITGAGQPLSPATRTFFESRLGRDLGGVRIHSDQPAGTTATSLNALAYTVGHDIAFAPGRFQPATAEGKRLLAHELVHVVQQENPPRLENEGPRSLKGHPPILQAKRSVQRYSYGRGVGPSFISEGGVRYGR